MPPDPRRTLTPTALTILGVLSRRPRSGYEIKQAADRWMHFFWGVSYGQIYPQLKVLHAAGLIAPVSGDGRRQTFKITAAGRKALRAWLQESQNTFQVRDEGLAKFMFAGALSPPERARFLRDRKDALCAELAAIRSFEVAVDSEFSTAAQRYGEQLLETMIAWCDETYAALEAAALLPAADT